MFLQCRTPNSRFWIAFSLVAGLACDFGPALAAESHPGLGAEVLFAEAVLAHHRKQTQEVLGKLNELLVETPNHIEALELKALTLKSTGGDKDAVSTYRKLLELKPPAERGPYHYELGMIYQKHKKTDAAKGQFEASIKRGFNPIPSHFFAGNIDFSAGKFSSAERHFDSVTQLTSGEMGLASHFYLGLVYLKTGAGTAGIQQVVKASELSKSFEGSQVANDISGASSKILDTFTKGQWFGNFSLMSQYDSNISLIPTGSVDTSQTSGKATAKGTLIAGGGYMSPALSALQYVAGYRLTTNKNLNAETRNYEYFTSVPSLYLNIKPLSRWSGGLKLEGVHLFQNQLQDSANPDSAYVYRQYSLSGEVSPYFKFRLNPTLFVQMDVGYRVANNYSDDEGDGNATLARLSFTREAGSEYFNPALNLGYERNDASGSSYSYSVVSASLQNTLRLRGAQQLKIGLDYSSTDYFEDTAGRSDTNLTYKLGWVKPVTPAWSMVADFSLISNSSSIAESYNYSRYNSAFGISWNL